MKIYGEITKVEALDDGTIRVAGVASSGAVDDADEQVSPDAMKAALPAYMRFGALREMHGLSAAGATLSAEVGEDGLTRIEAHVVDPVAVKKVQLGVYKGFSIGGKVLARDPGDRKVITKLKLNEISLVDRPCNPEAVIDMWKAGPGDPPPAPTNAEVIEKAVALAAAAGKHGRYKNFLVKAREALIAAADDGALDDGPGEAPSAEWSDLNAAAKIGARNSQADLALIQAAHDHMVELGATCAGESADGGCEPDGDDDEIDGKTAGADDLAKLWAENIRLAGALDAVGPEIEAQRGTVASLTERLEQVAATPAPAKAVAGAVRAISKAEDADPGAVDANALSAEALRKFVASLPEEELGQLQLRAALRRPIAVPR